MIFLRSKNCEADIANAASAVRDDAKIKDGTKPLADVLANKSPRKFTMIGIWGRAKAVKGFHMSELKQEFAYSQRIKLSETTEDRNIKAGICAAICFDWIKRALAGVKVSEATYDDPSFLMPQQRAVDLVAEHSVEAIEKFWTKIAKGDKLTMALLEWGEWVGGSYELSAPTIDKLKEEVYLLSMQGEHFGHATAFHVTKNSKRWFDPNLGQYAGSGNIGASHSKLMTRYQTWLSPGDWRLYRFSGMPRDAAWLRTNPGK